MPAGGPRKGNCWNNAVVESLFSSLKLELVYTTDFATHEQAWLALFEYIKVFYNRLQQLAAMTAVHIDPLSSSQLLRVD